jgi:hypothetical protein
LFSSAGVTSVASPSITVARFFDPLFFGHRLL